MANVEIHPQKNWTNIIEVFGRKLSLTKKDILSKSFAVQKLKKILRLKFVEKWSNELFNDERKGKHGNKLRTYRLFKSNFGREEYLLAIKSQTHRKTHSSKLARINYK